MTQSTIESKNKKEVNNGKVPAKETILSPRFYTTDFEAMENMDLSINEEELEAICEEFRKDYNRHHFVRNTEFEGAAEKLDPDTRELFVDFLEGSCTSEFSGFLNKLISIQEYKEEINCNLILLESMQSIII